MSDTLITPSGLELRAKLEEMVRRDLLGPAGGPQEEIDETNVRSRYILGLLAPRGQSLLPDDQDDLPVDGAEDGQDGKTDTAIPQMASMLPSSIGLTFSVDGAGQASPAIALQITVRWGYYRRARSETLLDDKGEARLVWKRQPLEAVSDPIPLREGSLGPWFPDADNQEVHVRGLCRRREDAWTVTLFLVNAQEEPPTRKDEAWIFQPELIVRAPDAAPIFIKRRLPELGKDEPEDRAMQMLYRNEIEFAAGHGVAVHAVKAEGAPNRAIEVRTEVMPS